MPQAETNIEERAAGPAVTPPRVNRLGFGDLRACFRQGLADFRDAPLFGLFFGGVFAAGGILIIQSLYIWEKGWLIYPILVGFPLLGPFAAVGLYEVSRRLQQGQPLDWSGILTVIKAQKSREIPWMAFVMLFIFWIWMYQIRIWLAILLGQTSLSSWGRFVEVLFTTPEGLIFIAVSHLVGACFAILMFSVTVVSLPLLLDRDADFITAMITSVKTVLANPLVMLSWGGFIGLLLMLSFIPLFLGLLVVLPVLGHASWHIYQRAVS